jgi:hypothetical protein
MIILKCISKKYDMRVRTDITELRTRVNGKRDLVKAVINIQAT